jgi:cellulose synthase/poly-beta-1,6-N-acetylglucosamine synthase-like glycosyltransferase
VKFSIIIPVIKINQFCKINVWHLKKIVSVEWELIIITDKYNINIFNDTRIKIIKSGNVPPGIKRDIGANAASNEILVFLDDDSYPDPMFLLKAQQFFYNKNLVGIGGPAITPINNSLSQKLSGAVFGSNIGGGVTDRYYIGSAIKKIDDWPSVNFMIRKSAFKFVGGFKTKYWPGEDTILFFKLNKYFKGKIIYVPRIFVYHHRRKDLRSHLVQISQYGLHRGLFFKKFGGNSRKFIYLIPSLFLVFLVLFFLNEIFYISKISLYSFRFFLFLYCLFLIKFYLNISKYNSAIISILSVPYFILTHIFYGFYFFIGIINSKFYKKNFTEFKI